MPKQPVTITFLRHDNPAYKTADQAAFMEYTKAHSNVTINDTTIDYRTLVAQLAADLKRDQFTYDFVLIPPSLLCTYADNLAEVPASVASLTEAQNTFFAAPLQGSTCGGKLKGLPVEYNLEYGGVVVNLDKYQAKYPGKTPGWSDWASFIKEASELSEYDANMKPAANGLDIDPDWPQPAKHIFFSQIIQRGGNYWSAKNDGTFDFGTQAAKDSFTAMVNWVNKDKVMFPSSLVPDKDTFVTTRLATGASGYGWNDPAKPLSIMGYCGTWGIPSATDQNKAAGKNTRFDFAPLPPMVGTEHRFVQNSGWAFAVPKSSKHQDVAWDVIKSMALSPDAMRKWSAVTGSLPALKVNGTVAAAASDPLLAKVQPLLEKGQWVGYIPADALETVEGAIVSNFFAAAKGTKTIDQALTDMQKTANDALALARK
jgi:multiple sugar transport system substrate-binding protein